MVHCVLAQSLLAIFRVPPLCDTPKTGAGHHHPVEVYAIVAEMCRTLLEHVSFPSNAMGMAKKLSRLLAIQLVY
jgi:hypothetical protein